MSSTLLMPFLDKSETYVLGFEIGQMWEKMDKNEKLENYLFHTENTKQVELMCKRFLYSYEIEIIDSTWSKINCEISASIN